jgi:hypothetical protein
MTRTSRVFQRGAILGVPLLMKKLLLMGQIGIVLCLGALGCLPSSNVVVARVVGPECTVTLSQRNSGLSTSRGSTIVSVILNGVPDNDTHGEIVLEMYGRHSVEMKWVGPRDLSLSCQQCTPKDVNFEAVKVGDLAITYDKNLDVR